MRIALLLPIGALGLAACAADPTRIEPAFVPSAAFAASDCPAIAAGIAEREPFLEGLVRDQSRRRDADMMSGIFIGITPSMLDPKGAQESEIARLKGELAALRAEGAAKACALPPQSAALTAALDPTPMTERSR